MKRRLTSLLSDAFWLYLLPASATIMSWSLYFQICRRLTKVRHPYRAAIEAELEFAQTLLPDLDPARFRHEQALTKFVDAADFYLTLTRTHRWFRRHVTVNGAWPSSGQAMTLLGSHWGAAHWIWRDLEHVGIRAWFIAKTSSAVDFGRGRLAKWYGQLRGWGMRRSGCSGVITTGGAMKQIAAALRRNEAIVVLADVPATTFQRATSVTLLGRAVSLSTDLLSFSIQQGAELAWFSMAIDLESGHRTLRIAHLAHNVAPIDFIESYVSHLSNLVFERPGGWQIWALAPELFADRTRKEDAG